LEATIDFEFGPLTDKATVRSLPGTGICIQIIETRTDRIISVSSRLSEQEQRTYSSHESIPNRPGLCCRLCTVRFTVTPVLLSIVQEGTRFRPACRLRASKNTDGRISFAV